MIISHSKPTLDADDVRNVRKVMQSGQIAGGKAVRKLEKKISGFIGVKDGVAGVKSAVFYRYIVKLKRKRELPKIINSFRRKGMSAERPVYRPLHKYLKLKKLPNTEEVHSQCISSLPIYPRLKETEVKYIIDTVAQLLG